MVRTAMSSDNSDPEELDSLVKAKDKIILQQSLIDSSARTLQRLKESTSRLISTAAPNINGITQSSNGESQSAIDDDIRIQENKLMKGFSNQLLEKHRYLKHLSEDSLDHTLSLEKIKQEFDQLINLQLFLDVTGLQPCTAKALLEEENLTLDLLFNMVTPELEQLLAKYSIATAEGKKLLSALDHLSTYYEMWERGIKPSVNAHNRLDSTASSRLNSISNLSYLDHQDSRMDSLSSCASSTSPLPAHYSNTSFFTPTPPTPSSTHSLLSPSSPFSMALPSSTPLNHSSASSQTPYMIPVLTPPPPGPMSSGISTRMQTTPSSHGLIRSHSSSSNVLLGESEPPSRSLAHSHHSVSSLSNNYRSQGTPTGGRGHTGGNTSGNTSGERKLKKPLTHKRSLSNPLTNIILNEEQEATPTNSVHSSSSPSSHHRTTNGSSLACYNYRSPSPPSRAGSQPSITSNSVGNSPQPNQRVRHPPMKHISSKNPSFSQSIPCDDFPSGADPSISGSESVLYRQNTWQHLEEENAPPRCNSMAGMSRPNYSQSSRPSLNHMDLTSSSMVNLPVGVYNGSTENLDEVDDCNLPSSGKSRSVPKLTLMTVSTDNDRGIPSASTPTSPRTPGTYTPTRHMRHAIMHRFTTKTYITPHLCDFCKKSVMIAVRCKDCKYKCHKSCAPKAPPSCGLPQELINYFRKHVALTSSMERLADQRVVDQAVQSPSERNVAHHKMNRSNTYDLDMRDPDFLIQNLASEPTNIHYSPILEGRRHAETINGIISHELSSQSSSTSLLEVPHTRIPGMYRSTSSTPSPSTSPPTSPSLTPSSPQSPNDYAYPHYSPQRTAERKHESNGFYSDSMKHCDESDEFYSESPYSSACSSINDISDHTRTNVDTPCGMRPGPQIILAKSLPDLLRISPTESDVENSCSKFLETSVVKKSEGLQRVNRRVSVDSHNFHGNKRESLQRTLSTADSKASTLVASVPTEEDDGDSDSYISSQDGETYRPGRSLVSTNTESFQSQSDSNVEKPDTEYSLHLNLASLCAQKLSSPPLYDIL